MMALSRRAGNGGQGPSLVDGTRLDISSGAAALMTLEREAAEFAISGLIDPARQTFFRRAKLGGCMSVLGAGHIAVVMQ